MSCSGISNAVASDSRGSWSLRLCLARKEGGELQGKDQQSREEAPLLSTTGKSFATTKPVSQVLLKSVLHTEVDPTAAKPSTAAELVGLASQPAIDMLCRRRAPMKRSGSVANNGMPPGLAAYWNYESKNEKLGEASA